MYYIVKSEWTIKRSVRRIWRQIRHVDMVLRVQIGNEAPHFSLYILR